MTQEGVEAGWSEAQTDCRRLFEENSQPMWVVELSNVLDVNRAAVLHYGYSRDEFLAMTIDALEPSEAPEEKVAESARVVWKHRRKDGSLIYVEIFSFAVTFRGRPALLTSALDVTSRRATEAQTRDLEFLLATAKNVLGAEDTIRALLNDALTALEAERGRIARELRAETAQSLASLLVALRTLEEAHDLGQARGAASTVRWLVSSALDGVQCLARGLGPKPSTL
jgi:two-component system cell cycle sensor histidine kinase/response regulator CckA